jgi:uncharacterized protein YodC (DUF2158 family)
MANGAREGLNVGDVVELKSGGPDMTITGFNGESAICAGFDGNENKVGAFHVSALRRSGGHARER